MRFKEVASRLTGFSVPLFGVSWNPPEPEVAAARRVLAFLEDRRVLFNPYDLEVVGQCIHSVVNIRSFLTEEVGRLSSESKLAEHLRGIRAACRRFLDRVSSGPDSMRRPHYGRSLDSDFLTRLGELRMSVGHRVAAIALMYGLDIEGELADTLPEVDKDDV